MASMDRKALITKLHLKQKLYAHRLVEGSSLEDHLNIFKEIVSDLKAMEVTDEDEYLPLILLYSLPPSYSTFRDTILYSHDSLTLDDVYDTLLSKEKMKHNITGSSENHANGLMANTVAVSQSGTGGKILEKICSYCKKKGHIISECNKLQNNDSELRVAISGEYKGVDEWILYTGGSYHMCAKRESFTTYESFPKGVVTLLTNESTCRVVGIGTVRIKMFDGIIRTFENVRHVPDLIMNIISLSTMTSNGYEFRCEGEVFKVSKGSKVFLTGHVTIDNIYALDGSVVV